MKERIRVKTVWKCDRCGAREDYAPHKEDIISLRYGKYWKECEMRPVKLGGLCPSMREDRVFLCTVCFVQFQEMVKPFGLMGGRRRGGPVDEEVKE